MKIKHLLFIGTVSGLISLGIVFLQQTRTRAASPSVAGTITVVASETECARCQKKCRPLTKKCAKGNQTACYKAAACLCRCNLNAGGCGSSKNALRECIESNERAARGMTPPKPL